MSAALILTYHGIETGPAPLCIQPALFARHLDCIVASGARALTIGQLADAVRSGRLPERGVAITFDDGYASVVRQARPLLAERGLVATVFCVARRVGSRNEWPSQASWAPSRLLAGAEELRDLTEEGWEIGSHGLDHDALAGFEPAALRRELEESRRILRESLAAPIRSFAYPYGVVPSDASVALTETGFTAGCTNRAASVRPGADPFTLPRVDAHYLRRPGLLRAALDGRLDVYLGARDLGARARRLARKDFVPAKAP